MAKNIKGLFETLNPSQEQKDRMLNSIVSNMDTVESNSKPKHFVKFLKPLTAMVLICLVVIGGLNFIPSGTNEFSMNVYAMDTEDGQPAKRIVGEMRPVEGNSGAMVASNSWFGYYELEGDTISFYIDLGWQIEGTNIKTAEITIDDGYFLNKIGRYDFEIIGTSVILDKEDIHKGDMLYVGYDRPVTYVEKEITTYGENAATGETWEETSMEIVPEFDRITKIVIHAAVTYENGKTEEKDMIFDEKDTLGASYISLESRRLLEP